MGNIGKIEQKTTAGGMVIVEMSIACAEKKKQGDEWVDHTEWIPVKFFGNKAEAVAKFFEKGRKILIEGKFVTNSWDDKDGNKRYKSEIIGTDFYFCDSKKSNGGQFSVTHASNTSPIDNNIPIDTDDLPF